MNMFDYIVMVVWFAVILTVNLIGQKEILDKLDSMQTEKGFNCVEKGNTKFCVKDGEPESMETYSCVYDSKNNKLICDIPKEK